MSKPWIGYVRLSIDEQADTSTLRSQIEQLKEAGAESVLYDVESGQEEGRDNLKQVLDLVNNQEVTGVISTRLDRLTRSHEEYLHIKEIFRKSGAQLHFLNQGAINLETASGELYADLQACLLKNV